MYSQSHPQIARVRNIYVITVQYPIHSVGRRNEFRWSSQGKNVRNTGAGFFIQKSKFGADIGSRNNVPKYAVIKTL